MKIAFVNQPIGLISPTDQRGSIEIWIYQVARRLVDNYDVVVLAKKGSHQKKVEYNKRVYYRRFSTHVDQVPDLISRNLLKMRKFSIFRNFRRALFFHNPKRPFFDSRFYYFTYLLQVANYLRGEKCDIVHLHNFSSFVPFIRTKNPEIKIVLHMHCEWLTQLDRKIIEPRLEEVDLILGCSNYITNKIRYKFPQFAERCKTLYNGVDVNSFVLKDDRIEKNDLKRLLYVGRVSPEKGIHILLEAFKQVVKIYPMIQLEIIGSKEQVPIEYIVALSGNPKVSTLKSFYNESYISTLKRKLSPSIKNKVTFTGLIPRQKLIDHFRKADLLVFPSVWDEPFGMPPIESMAMGIPVISTKVGGIPETIVDEKTGILVEPNNASALAEAIISLINNKSIRKKMGENAHKHVFNHFSWEKTVENLLHYYKKIL